MKKLILLLVVFLIASCSNTLQITKRHYLKGYYVSHTKHHKEKNTTASVAKNTKPSPIVASVAPSDTEFGEHVSNSKEHVSSDPTPVLAQPKLFASAPMKKKTLHTIATANHRPAVFTTKPLTHLSTGNGDEARSLFWIVILVLLILWALGIISGSFGLGILFNLLLLIALILLILWLLRIV